MIMNANNLIGTFARVSNFLLKTNRDYVLFAKMSCSSEQRARKTFWIEFLVVFVRGPTEVGHASRKLAA